MQITVLFLSCRRLKYLIRTVASIRSHIADLEPNVQVRYHCLDNGSSMQDRIELQAMGFDHLILSSENVGIAQAMNHLVSSVRTPYVLNLQDDWVVDNPSRRSFINESIRIIDSDQKIAHVKLDIHHFVDFTDRSIYDGPFISGDGRLPFYVQNPNMLWGGFSFPPAVTKTEAFFHLGPFREDNPFQRGWAESEYTQRYAQKYVAAKSPDMLIFRHIGDEAAPGWTHDANPIAQDVLAPMTSGIDGMESRPPPSSKSPPIVATSKGEMGLSICITAKNRSKLATPFGTLELLPNCIKSIAECVDPGEDVEIIVSDWKSDDWPLAEWLPAAAKHVPYRIITVDDMEFSRGKGRNISASAARGNVVLFIDADIIVSRQLIDRSMAYALRNEVFFPVFISYDDHTHTTGWWRETGFGLCASSRALFEAAGRWPEWKSYGGEDNVMHERFEKVATVKRERVEGTFHQWHPHSDPYSKREARRDWIEHVSSQVRR